MTDLKALRAIAEAATPGPWCTKQERQRPRAIIAAGTEQIADAAEHVHWTDRQCEANATHIAAFNPAQAIALLDEVESLRKLLGEACAIAAAQVAFHPTAAGRIAAIRKKAGVDE